MILERIRGALDQWPTFAREAGVAEPAAKLAQKLLGEGSGVLRAPIARSRGHAAKGIEPRRPIF